MTATLKSPRSIFLEAIENHAPHDWPEFLDSACGGDQHVHNQVTRLLGTVARLDGFMARPAAPTPSAEALAGNLSGQTIGRYKLLEQIGEGGMGVVYVAEQTAPVRRRVALKIIKPGMDTRQVIARFEAERQALALMDHPNIARILDAGTVEESTKSEAGHRREAVVGTKQIQSTKVKVRNEEGFPLLDTRPADLEFVSDFDFRASDLTAGRPFFVMELVLGLPITGFCDRQRLDVRQRLALFITVCRAVQHAHHKGIIHRDLKPNNVLVTMHDGQPVPKVIDFGVAKAVNQQLTEHSIHTQFAQMIGTPLYMSPEQAELGAHDIDTRSDVYSLGVLLYELLTGRTPFDLETLQSAGFDEMRRIIREDDPPRPSTRPSTRCIPLNSTVADRNGLVRQMVQHVKGELDWIVMKALEKDRNRRYESASALAADVQRYLDHQPIQARPASLITRTIKWRRRNPVAFLTGIAGILVIAAAATAGVWHNHRLADSLAVSEQRRLDILRQQAELHIERYAADMRFAFRSDDDEQRSLLLDRYDPKGGEPDIRGFEWHYLRQVSQPLLAKLDGHQTEAAGIDISPDRRFAASGDHNGELRIWDLAANKLAKSLPLGKQELHSVRFSPDGKWLASGGTDMLVRVWSVPDWQLAATLKQHQGTIRGLAWSPTGDRLASASRGGGLACIWDARDWSLVKSLLHSDELSGVVWSPQGNLLATLERFAGIRLWDTATWQDRGLLDCRSGDSALLAVAFSPGGGLVAAGGYGSKLRLFDVSSRELVEQAQSGQVWSLAFLDEENLVQGGGSALHFWAYDRGQKTLTCLHTRATGDATHRSLALSRNGQLLASADSKTGQVAVWDARALAGFHSAAFRWPSVVSPKQRFAVGPDGNRAIAITRLADGKAVAQIQSHHPDRTQPCFSLDESLLAVANTASEIQLWDTATWRVRRTLLVPDQPSQRCRDMKFSPDGQWLAGGLHQGCYGVWNVQTGHWQKLSAPMDADGGMVEFSTQGLLACAIWGRREVTLWDLARNRRVGKMDIPTRIQSFIFLPDETLAISEDSGTISLWNPHSGQQTGSFPGHVGRAELLALSPDGRTLASTGNDYTVRLWNIPTRRELFTLWQAPERVRELAFRPNGDLTFTTESQKTQWVFPGSPQSPAKTSPARSGQ